MKPFGVLMGDSIAKGTPLGGRLQISGAGTVDLNEPNAVGQISYHLSQSTGMYWYNHGISPQRTDQIITRWPRDVLGETVDPDGLGVSQTLPKKADCVVVMAGINDVSQGIDEQVIKDNLEWIMNSIQDNDLCGVICLMGPWGAADAAQVAKIKSVNAWTQATAPNYGVRTFDAYSWGEDANNADKPEPSLYHADEIHLEGYGYDHMSSAIVANSGAPWKFNSITIEANRASGDTAPQLAVPTKIEIVSGSASLQAEITTAEVNQVPFPEDNDPNVKDFTIEILDNVPAPEVVGSNGIYSGFGMVRAVLRDDDSVATSSGVVSTQGYLVQPTIASISEGGQQVIVTDAQNRMVDFSHHSAHAIITDGIFQGETAEAEFITYADGTLELQQGSRQSFNIEWETSDGVDNIQLANIGPGAGTLNVRYEIK